MLTWNVLYLFMLHFIVCIWSQVKPETTEAIRCWINSTEISARTDIIELKLTTIREACNFSVIYSSVSPETNCHSTGDDSKYFQCLIKDLNPGTFYQLEIISTTDGERTNVSVQTDPEPPTDVVVEPDSDATSGLRVHWSHPRGRVDWYELSLEDAGTGDRRSTRVMGSAAPQLGFTALTPGTLYTVHLQATAGDRVSAPARSTAATAPSAIRGLRLSASSSNISVSWQPGPGRTEHFWVLLREQESLVQNVTVGSGVTSHSFTGVTPGTLHTVAVAAQSMGIQSDSVSKEVLAGKAKMTGGCFQVCQMKGFCLA
ncbi:receptor-type tyrosine-protein phosphatase beta-like isoform X2 [Clupea harengus]|uniref:Receptor-type tyrosine-protein phosphatase beta-like isoform X2 n=1 Tax=Clupea harengus TaxID=7950 RepID=A0A6P8F7U2_CLUHA|nr:receptor-type tyrosine-protein phosphatase beta-like isoform X2 [Clupea harengus]